MSVVAAEAVRRRIWRGWDDPSLPVANWVGRVAVTGDASAGDMTIQLELWPEAQPGAGHFFSLEQLELWGSGLGGTASILFINFSEPDSGGGFGNREWSVQMSANELGNTAILTRDIFPRPIFLGQPRIPNGRAAISANVDNEDGETFEMQAEGYIWEPRSVQAEGGLQRPARALYG